MISFGFSNLIYYCKFDKEFWAYSILHTPVAKSKLVR